MMAADRHQEVRKRICLLLKTIMDVVKPREDYFEPLLNALIEQIQNENEMIQGKAFSALSSVVVRSHHSFHSVD